MTAAEFKKKWGRFQGKETSAYQGHFDDLCRLLGQPTPVEADPTGNDVFCYQKRVTKDAELFDLERPDSGDPTERGFADVWKSGCFGWEYKGKKKNLDEAYKQLLRYREALLNPPLLVVCDFDRYIIRTNFNGTVQETYQFTNDKIDQPENWRILRALFENPDSLKPQRTTAQVTQELAATIAEVARSLQGRECVELADAATRREVTVAQKTNLRIARFLNRIVFCLFAEDTGLLPAHLFKEVAKTGLDDPHLFAASLEDMFRVMAKGGRFGAKTVRHFNGHLFEESTVFELTEDEIRKLVDAAEADWQFIQPSIMGTLFERALDESQRAQLGAHYTSEADIKTLVEPVLMQPLRNEWAQLKSTLLPACSPLIDSAPQRERLAEFQHKLASISVLDPACGSGNFLYVALQLLLGLEKEVVTFATQLGVSLQPQVSVQQLQAIEINPYAFELAQVSVQIGYLQWRRDNGFDNDRTPVLQNLDGFQNEDALLVPHYHSKAKTLKEAQAGEHKDDGGLKFYTERTWPDVDVIVGNPPFLGNKRMRSELGDAYARAVFDTFGNRLPATSDFCCYWFEKARELVAEGKCKRVGLLATTGSKQVSSRRAFDRIKKTGKIFFAISDRDWFDDGVAIRICMVGFAGSDASDGPVLDGTEVADIHADISAGLDTTGKRFLIANQQQCFMGTTKVGDFDIPREQAVEMLHEVNPHGKPNSDVLRPFRNGSDIVRIDSGRWVIDFGVTTTEQEAARYEQPFEFVRAHVKPFRDTNNRKLYRAKWWIHAEPRPGLRAAVKGFVRYIGTARVAKHRLFVWLDSPILPDSKVIAIAFEEDLHFGILHSRFHEAWTLATCGWHGKGNDATYNPTECFETFPFPSPTPAQAAVIAAAAKELNELRERWLNPPELTADRILEFPGTLNGPWSRFVVTPNKNGLGTVRYPHGEPRDEECAAKLKTRTLTNLYNERPAWLDHAHKKLDAAVAAAYGWPTDLTDEQILERLLALNLACAAEEEPAKVKRPKTYRGTRPPIGQQLELGAQPIAADKPGEYTKRKKRKR